jgi:outer membrane protein assembly factor BamD
VENYQTTSHVPEALHRLVEAYLKLGITEEAYRYAAVLGHNFPNNVWYRDSYKLITGVGSQKTKKTAKAPAPATETKPVELKTAQEQATSSKPPESLAQKPVLETPAKTTSWWEHIIP